MAVFSRPLASSGVEGTATFRPGTWVNMASSECECWADSWWPAPPGMRMTMGTSTCPPNM